MTVTYRNNRVAPAIVIGICLLLFYFFIDFPIDELSTKASKWSSQHPLGEARPPVELHPHPGMATSDKATEESVAEASVDYEGPNRGLSTDDVLLVMKTGGTSMWKRLLVHLATTLSGERIKQQNMVIYSDLSERVGSFTTIDIFENTTGPTRNRPEFDIYRAQAEYAENNVYVEFSGVAGDDWGPVGGWVIDKFKFVPLMQHAGENWPDAKWYIYMEDDTYLFLPNVLSYLSTFDWREPHYLGSYAAKSDVIFAHGGAGFAISRAAWKKSFGRNANMSQDFEKYTADHCCGDQVLGRALNEYGVRFGENGGDEKFTWGFNPVVHWNFGFSRWNWCSPLLSWHKVHSRDVARYYDLEKSWDFMRPLRYCDFYLEIIRPGLRKRIEWWDNLSSLYEVTSANKNSPPMPEAARSSVVWANAWQSVDTCEAACQSWEDCTQWSYVEDLCKMDDKVTMGQGYAGAMSQRKTALMTTSGWLIDRLENWHCD